MLLSTVYATQNIAKDTELFNMSSFDTMDKNNKFAITLDAKNHVYLDLEGKDASLLNHRYDRMSFLTKTKE